MMTCNCFDQSTGLRSSGNVVVNEQFFDTLTVRPRDDLATVLGRAMKKEINLRYNNNDGSVCYTYFHYRCTRECTCTRTCEYRSTCN